MTQQYIVGELSLLIARLQALAPDPSWVPVLERARRDSEVRSPGGLEPVARQLLITVDGWCADSLDRGDVRLFAGQSAAAADLWEFAVCAGILDETAG